MNTDNTFPVTTDALILSRFAAEYCARRRVRHALDLGCGSGIVAVEVALKCPEITFLGIEILQSAAETAARNIREAGLDARVSVVTADLRRHREIYSPGAFDLAVANPPYFVKRRGRTSPDAARDTARAGDDTALSDFCGAASYGVRNGGAFLFVIRAERLAETFRALTSTGFEPKRLRFAQKDAASAPRLALVDARRGGKPGLEVMPPLYL